MMLQEQFWEGRPQNSTSTLKHAQWGAMCSVSCSCSRRHRKNLLLWILSKTPRVSRLKILHIICKPATTTGSLNYLKTYLIGKTLFPAWNLEVSCFAATPKSTLELLALHLIPLLKVAGLALSCPKSIFPPSSRVRTQTMHRALCEMGTIPWQTSLWLKTKCNFHSISYNTCSCNFRRGWRAR